MQTTMLWFTLQGLFACNPIGWHCELIKSVSWVTWSVNQCLPERGIFVGMFHGAEPCTMEIQCRCISYFAQLF